MKKLLFITLAILGLTFSAQAQKKSSPKKASNSATISDNALGLRFGSANGFGTEISYQKRLSKANRLEVDLGFANHNYNKNYNGYESSSVQLTGVYQWTWNIEGGFNWYAGVGGSLGTYSWDYPGYSDSEFNLGVVGDIGIEYDFEEAPFQLSLDWRPGIIVAGTENNGYHGSVALGVRYRF